MRGFSPWSAAFLGAAVVGAAWVIAGSGERPVQHPDDVAPSDLSASAGQIEILDRLDDIERRLDAVARAVAARPAAPPGGPVLEGRTTRADEGAAPSDATPAPEPVITEEVLERTLERIEEKKYAKMTSEGLTRLAEKLLNQSRDPEGAKRVLELLMKRPLEREERTRALTTLGMVHRSLKDYASSEEAFREVIRSEGADSTPAAWAGYQLVWTLKSAGKPDRALAEADRILRSPGVNEHIRPSLRWAAAMLAHETGDHARARGDLRALVEEFKDDKANRHIVMDATRRLKQLE